ncbi:MAG: hypothetical protein F4Z80_08950 [Chloroflexi bacterium]|nr:hypothetical protein [Chloroflexota bacterium]
MIRRNGLSRRRREFGVRLAVLLGLAALLLAAQPLAAQGCSFQLGFKALRDLIPDVVGECLENEHHDPETGLTQQATSNGLLTWRKADNWTGFFDRRHTWVRGPAGVRQWPNDEYFPWEAWDPPDRSMRRITLDQLLNAEYRLPLLGGEDTPIRLADGEASIASEREPSVREYAGVIAETAAFSDLNGDGYTDAAIVAFTSGGGSGTFIHLVAFLDRGGEPVQAARAFLGDRVRVERLAAARGGIVADTVSHGPGDGLCCPSLSVTRRYLLRGDRLIPQQALVIGAPLPGESVASGIQVRGTASTTPGSGSLTYLVYDARGGVIGTGTIPVAEGSESDYPTTFAAPIEFFAARDEPGRIEIIDPAVARGMEPARTSVGVILQAAPLTDGRERREPVSELVLELPASGSTVFGSLELRGRISSLPFEKNLSYRLYDRAGANVGEGYITVQGEFGGPGTFAKSVELPEIIAPRFIRVEIREESPVDGALIVSTSAEFYFAGSA